MGATYVIHDDGDMEWFDPSESNDVDMVNHPPHYKAHPSGVECIEIVEHFQFCIGNAIKYLWRAGIKTDDPLEDLRKAHWYISREIDRIERQQSET